MAQLDYENARATLNEKTGIVISVFLSPDYEYDSSKCLIEDTILSFLGEVSEPASIYLSAD